MRVESLVTSLVGEGRGGEMRLRDGHGIDLYNTSSAASFYSTIVLFLSSTSSTSSSFSFAYLPH